MSQELDDIIRDIKALRTQPIIIKVDIKDSNIFELHPFIFGTKQFEVGKYYDFDFNETNKEYNSFEFLDNSRIDGFPIFRTRLIGSVYLPDIFGTVNIQLVTPLEDNRSITHFHDPNYKPNPMASPESRQKQEDKFNKVTTK